MLPERPRLQSGDTIVTAWAETCSGPGWVNQVVWVLIASRAGALRVEALQPHEQSRALARLHRAAAAVTELVRTEVQEVMSMESDNVDD